MFDLYVQEHWEYCAGVLECNERNVCYRIRHKYRERSST